MENPAHCDALLKSPTLSDIPENRIITAQSISKIYSEIPFSGVKAASFTIDKGKIVAIVGESGSGKSTLLKLLYGLLTPEEGSVYFKTEAIRGPEKKLIPGHDSMKMVTQDFSLNTYAKVYDNIASMLPNTNLKYKAEKTQEMLDLLRIKHLAQKRVSDLSGGEQQRVAIAKAIVTEPEVLLMDEPFSQVDTVLKSHLRADIRRLSKQLGITIIIVSHDPVDGLSLADELIVMKRGTVIEQGEPHQLYSSPQNLYTARLLSDCNVLSPEHAADLGINESSDIAIYPQDILAGKGALSADFYVKEVFYKGFHDELLLEKGIQQLRALNYNVGTINEGELVSISIKRYHRFGAV